MPWKATRTFDKNVSTCSTTLAVVATMLDWMQPLQTHAAYLKASKDQSMRHWVSFYNFIWFTKKGVACNEIYRMSSRFHWESRNPLEYIVSILKIIAIFGDRVIEPEQLEKASTMLWRKRAKRPKNDIRNSAPRPKGRES